jgi:hypothetical protein
MKRRLALALTTAATAASCAAELVPFAPPWDDGEAGPTDLRPVLAQGAHDIAPVRVRDGHLFAGDRRLRLFGVNLTAGACFPDRATAESAAARMAKFGINGVRLHFLDSTWGTPRLIDYASGSWTNWNAEAQERLDYFLARLKEQGIYWNVNLLVGRSFGVGDGVDPAIGKLDWKTAHAVGFFHAPHLEAQKAYARRLLNHVNPHTKLALAHDPALAFVEINNENGLLHTWLWSRFDDLPEPFAGDLMRQWNGWLAQRHADTKALAAAWESRNEPPGAELLRNRGFAAGMEFWNLEQHQGARAAASAANGEVTVRVDQPGTEGWSVQFNQTRLGVRKGALYTARFRAAADVKRKISATVMQAHEPWQSLGWYAPIEVGPEWTSHTFTFEASSDNENARFGFGDLSQPGAVFRFADLSLTPGGRIGLSEEESLEARSIRCPKAADTRPLAAGARREWIRFLWETERNHWEAMRRCLADEIGVKVPVVGTIVATSTPNLMSAFDVVDTHAYWQHPHFPGRDWDMDNWTVQSVSMADRPESATLSRLAWQRVAGKPHMVSEYNHPAPNPYAGEGPLMLAAVAALQDWDALFYYTWAHDEKTTKAGRIPLFFDVGQHPTIMANLPAAALLFRRGDLAAARTLVTAPLPPERELDLIARQGRAWQVLDLDRMDLDLGAAFIHRVALDTGGTAGSPPPAAVRSEWLSETGELAWRLPEKGRGIFTVKAPRAKLVIGRIAGKTVELGHGVRVTAGQTDSGWCTVALSLLEGESFDRSPKRALLTATAYAENTDMVWKDKERTSVGTQWGRPPSLVEPVPATITFAAAARAVRLHPLNDRGQRVGAAIEPRDAAAFAVGPEHRTLWYEVEFEGR